MTEELNPTLKPSLASRERPPFVSMLPRASAFAIDCIAIYFVGFTLEMFIREPLLALGPWLPGLAGLAAFAYFWLGNGPVGAGTTLGKAVVNIKTVSAAPGSEGEMLDYAASFKRALLQFPYVYFSMTVLFVDLAQPPTLIGDIARQSVGMVVTALMVTMIITIGSHPQHAAWHDRYARSSVVPDSIPRAFYDALGAEPSDDFLRRLRSNQRFARFFFFAILCVIGAGFVPRWFNSEYRASARAFDRVQEEATLEGFRLLYATYVPADLLRQFDEAEKEWAQPGESADESSERTIGTDDPAEAGGSRMTGGSVASTRIRVPGTPENAGLYFYWAKQSGALDLSGGLPDELAAQLEEFRARAAELLPAPGVEDPPALGARSELICQLTDQFRWVLISIGEANVWRIRGPLDPEVGPLRLTKVAAIKAGEGRGADARSATSDEAAGTPRAGSGAATGVPPARSGEEGQP